MNTAQQLYADPLTTNTGASDADDSPDVRHPDLTMFAEDRIAARDLVDGTRTIHAKLSTYLPKHEAEEPSDHQLRGSLTEVFNGFARTVDAMTGLVFSQPPILGDDVPKVLRDHYERLDALGTHGDVFLRDAFQDALPVGYGAFKVEYPVVPEVAGGARISKKDAAARKLRPYWTYVRAESICMWDWTADHTRLNLLILTETRSTRKGLFGLQRERVFLVYQHPDGDNQPITLETWAMREKDGVKKLVPIDEPQTIIGPSTIPFAPFQLGAPRGDIVARPALLDLLDLNLAHYRVNADRRYLMHLCCVPVPVRKGWRPRVDENGKVIDVKMSIGPNILQDLPADGAFGWAEPAGTAFVPTGEELKALENRMAALGLSFLQRDTRQAETAEARRLDGAAQNSTLSDAARRFEDAVETGFSFHAQFEGVAVSRNDTMSGGSFSLNREYEDTVLTDATLSLLSGMQEKNQLTLDTLWQLMERGKLLPDGFSPEKEKAALKLERDLNAPPDGMDDEDSPYKPDAKPKPKEKQAA